jgi:2'-5' RNA ligase
MSDVRQHLASTALVVLVPEAEVVVSAVRARFDPAAKLGVPPHVTLLFPFMPLSAISASVLASLQELFAGFASFTATFATVGRWPQQAYLVPEPEAPFIALTKGIAARFPGYPPYGGRHPEIIPHLTVAQGSAAAAERGGEEVSVVLAASGPVLAACAAATLLESSSGAWRVMHTFPLCSQLPRVVSVHRTDP